MNKSDTILNNLPAVRGRYQCDVSLAPSMWFRVGGPAQVVFRPADIKDLAFFMANCPKEIPVHVIGVGSNLLVRDGGIPGVVVRLGAGFNNLFVDGSRIFCGGAVLDRNVAMLASDYGIQGFEFLCGIPGTMGAAVRMNAGAYGTEIKDVLISATAVDRKGKILNLAPADLNMSYRHIDAPKDWIFVGMTLRGLGMAKPEDLRAKVEEMLATRQETQPVNSRTGGSTFANPEEKKAWELIDDAGCRGLQIGGAKISELHCNFMMNTGTATAHDLEMLGEEVKRRVLARSGIELRWEIDRIGIEDVIIKKEAKVA